jgi:hypothetical protein
MFAASARAEVWEGCDGVSLARIESMDPRQEETQRSLPEVVADIGQDVTHLVQGEIALLKTEMRQNAAKIGAGAGLFGGAGVAGMFALEFVLLAIVFGLVAAGLQVWAAALIVAAVMGAAAGLMALKGKKNVASASVVPTETVEQLKNDAATIRQGVDRLRSR